MVWLWKLFGLFTVVLAQPRITCPDELKQSRIVNDIGFLSETVSWDAQDVQGICGGYTVAHEAHGLYDTRMRIYRSLSSGDHFIIFRPTQQTEEGGAIHADRRMVDCSFFSGCFGKVHDRFQQAFIALVGTVADWTPYIQQNVFVGGHSLGGALAGFMGFFLWYMHQKAPVLVLGLAGPFIGDDTFAWYYHDELRTVTQNRWWQVETVDVRDSNNFDGTVEGYQVDPHQLFIDEKVVCAFPIDPLPIPSESYGMHDLKQYMLFFTGKTDDCPSSRRFLLRGL